jgi:hypothetical protein
MLYVLQPGFTYAFTDKLSLKGAFSYYITSNVKGRVLDGTTGTNSKDGSGNLLHDYSTLTPALELTIKEPFKALRIGFLDIPSLSLFGEFVDNPQVSKNGTGYMAGLRFGAEKISGWGDWQFTYNFAQMEKDAILDILPDSDRYGGKTGIRSHEAIFQYGLGKNTYLSLDYYYGWAIASAHRQPAHEVQLDWNLKF